MSDKRFSAVIAALHTALFTLAKPATSDGLIEMTLDFFGQRSASEVEKLFSQMSWGPEARRVDIRALVRDLVEVSNSLHTLDIERSGPARPRATHLYSAARELRGVADGYSAYLLCEVAYALTLDEGAPAPEIVELQLELARPDSDEWRAAAWRCAIEHCRDALARRSDWLSAIDAFEVAMTLPTANLQRQAELLGDLQAVLQAADASPLRVLKIALPVQAPKGYFDPRYVLKHALNLLSNRGEDTTRVDLEDAEAQSALRELGATMAQIYIDDERVLLRPMSRFSPEISWTDHSLSHAQLIDAVPLQRSLIVDIDRSADTLLELVHEITHAFTLLGPLGWARTAYRTATQFIEMLLIDQQRAWSTTDVAELEAVGPLTSIAATNAVTVGLCDAQFAAQLRSKTLQAVWTPWLEGVALYAELLCDPAGDSSQMAAPLLAIRSLVDPILAPLDGESGAATETRAWHEMHATFEAFCSQAIRRGSRFRHLGYLRTTTTPELYLLGYLLVRSVVSRWETTLGTRLAPAVATRLLLDATRNGTWDAIPAVDSELAGFEAECSDKLASFLTKLARLPADFLSAYCAPLETPKPRRYAWVGDVPTLLDPNDPQTGADIPLNAMGLAARAATTALALRSPTFVAFASEEDFAVAAATQGPAIEELFDRLHAQSSLVAVGHCDARLIVLDEARARVAFCPRTFAGLLGSTDTQDLAVPRYSVRVIELPGGPPALRALRRVLGERRRARVVCTRVIDMTGLPQTPFEAPNTSYVYFGLGDWRLVSADDTMRPIGPGFEQFENLLRLRVEAPALLQQEHRRLANSDWLLARADAPIAALDSALRLSAFSIDEAALRSAQRLGALAWGASQEALSAAVTALIGDTGRHSAVADYLVGHGAKALDVATMELGQIAFDGGALSGIRPFRIGSTQ